MNELDSSQGQTAQPTRTRRRTRGSRGGRRRWQNLQITWTFADHESATAAATKLGTIAPTKANDGGVDVSLQIEKVRRCRINDVLYWAKVRFPHVTNVKANPQH